MRFPLAIILCLLGFPAFTQLIVQLNVNPQLTPYLYEWESSSADDIIVFVDNLGTDQIPVVFQVRLYEASGIEIGFSSPSDTPIIPINPGSNVFPLAEVIPVSALEYTEALDQELIQAGQLPDGEYLMCVSILEIPGSD